MAASLDLESYEPWWKSSVFANDDMVYRLHFKTKKQAERMRFRGYGFMRAFRAWMADPMEPDVLKRECVHVLQNMRLKELILEEVADGWELVIRPRICAAVEIKEQPADLEAVLPTVKARIIARRETEEMQAEYERRQHESPAPSERDALQEYLTDVGFIKGRDAT